MNALKRSFEVLRDDGIVSLLRAIKRYLSGKVSNVVLWSLVTIGLVKGEFTLTVGDTTATFVAEDRDSVNMTTRRVQNERDRIAELLEEVEENDVFYDIGANTGIYTSFVGHHCSTVVAFEPHPKNVAELEKNADRNCEDVTVMDIALSDSEGTVGLSTPEVESSHYPDTDSPGYGGGRIIPKATDIEVSTRRGDKLIEEDIIDPPTVVKIDVEGAEPLVIDGLSDAFGHERCRYVDCEVHRPSGSGRSIVDYGSSEEELFQQFEELGFDTVTKTKDIGNSFILSAARGDLQLSWVS